LRTAPSSPGHLRADHEVTHPSRVLDDCPQAPLQAEARRVDVA